MWLSRRRVGQYSDRVLPILARLLSLSFGACALAGCKTVCHTHEVASRSPTDEVVERHPEIVADTWAKSELRVGTVPIELTRCRSMCGAKVQSCLMEVAGDSKGRPIKEGTYLKCVFGSDEQCKQDFDPFNLGSCPFGCGRLPSAASSATGIAALEALSVVAFAELSRELAAFGAPPALLARVERARRDEARHARLARRLFGPSSVPRVRSPARSLLDVAITNAVEGCVRETFGAIVAKNLARDSAFHAAVADDELAHAALAWDVHAWLMDRLDHRQRRKVLAARDRALLDLPGALGVAFREVLS